ncbi:MAG: hypothetical protein D6805_07655 [Planctomycetota bacterium]|nr:MAG: hypothetical protein D6805_07655 [Planctomycetota bacterium]
MLLDIAVIVATFVGVLSFVFIGLQMFSKKWESYEEKYLEEPEVNLQAALLTIPPQHVLYLSSLSGIVGYFLSYALLSSLMGASIFGVLFGFFPKIGLNLYVKNRSKRFGEQLVDALISLSNSLRAGHSLPKAVDLLSKEAADPMRQEMRIVAQEMRLGEPLEEALKHLHARLPNEDLELVITAISIAGEVGGNLTEIFDRIAETIRERQKIEGRIQSLTAQGKAQGWVVAMLPVLLALAVNYIDPQLFRPMYTTVAGWVLIGVVIVMELIGMKIIQKIVTIRV